MQQGRWYNLDTSIWICVFLPLFIAVFVTQKEKKKQHIFKIFKMRKKRGGFNMNELIKKFIGKECIITTMNESVTGIVESVEDNWIEVSPIKKNKIGSEIISLDYISRIREYPTSENGKRRIFVE